MASTEPLSPVSILDDAIEGRCAVKFWLNQETASREARFVNRAADVAPGTCSLKLKGGIDPAAIWLLPAGRVAEALRLQLATPNTRIAVVFAWGGVGTGFDSTVLALVKDFWLTESYPAPALLISPPSDFWLEHRAQKRFRIRNDGGGIHIKLSRPTPAAPADVAPRPVAGSPESVAVVTDISGGGAGFLCPFSIALLGLAPGEPFVVKVQLLDKQFSLFSRLACVRKEGNHVRLGLRFDRERLVASDPAALKLLDQMVSDLDGRERCRLRRAV